LSPQVEHAELAVAPVTVEKVFAEQFRHTDVPITALYFPGTHSAHGPPFGPLAPVLQIHAVTANFRDKQEHFNLSPDEKEELRDELLSEKARVKQLFQKVHLLKSLEIVDKTTRWIRKLPPTITTEDQFAAAALLDLFAGAPAPGGSADEDAAEQLEDSATDGGGRESDAYSEKRCTKHRMLFKECTDEECKEEVKGFGMHISNDSMEVCTWQKSFLLNNVSVMCPRCCTACES
jgi:hypothetical protein